MTWDFDFRCTHFRLDNNPLTAGDQQARPPARDFDFLDFIREVDNHSQTLFGRISAVGYHLVPTRNRLPVSPSQGGF